MAHDRIAVLVEDSHLVIALYQTLATFVIEQDDVAALSGLLLVITPGQRSPNVLMISAVCGRAPPALWAAKVPVGATSVAGHLPGLAVGDEDSRLLAARGLRR